jgi:hypothetical protein
MPPKGHPTAKNWHGAELQEDDLQSGLTESQVEYQPGDTHFSPANLSDLLEA